MTKNSMPAGMIPEGLSPVEQHAKAMELAEVCGQIDKLKADAAADASAARKKVRALTSRQRLLAECVRTGTEMVEAQEKLGFADEKKKRKTHNASNGNADA